MTAVSVTSAPSTATPPEATVRRAAFTVTWKALGAGTKRASRVWSKVTVSVAPSTSALSNAGAAGGSPLGNVPPSGSTIWTSCERLYAFQLALRQAASPEPYERERCHRPRSRSSR